MTGGGAAPADGGPLAGRVALVTGAGRNIGRAIALALAGRGAAVAVNVRANLAEGAEVVERIRAGGGRGLLVRADVSDPAAVAAMLADVRAALGPVDILVNNVGLRPRQSILEITDADWRRVIDAGLSGAFYCVRAAAPDMIGRRWGRIINISGRDGWTGLANRAHGVATKAGLHGLTKALALELGPHGITTNTVAPGYTDTTRPPEWYPDHDPQARISRIPLGRAGHVNDIAAACVYLAVDGGFVNGQAIHVNGGEFLIG